MKSRNKKHKLTSYKCIYCGYENNYSIVKFTNHLDINHKEISEADKKELIMDLKFEILKIEKALKRKLLGQKINIENKIKFENKSKKLIDYKNNVIKVLSESTIDFKKIEIIKSRKSIELVKRFLMFGIKKEFQVYLDKAGLDYSVKEKKRNVNQTKIKLEKEYYDGTKKSVRTLYTPMGNKR